MSFLLFLLFTLPLMKTGKEKKDLTFRYPLYFIVLSLLEFIEFIRLFYYQVVLCTVKESKRYKNQKKSRILIFIKHFNVNNLVKFNNFKMLGSQIIIVPIIYNNPIKACFSRHILFGFKYG